MLAESEQENLILKSEKNAWEQQATNLLKAEMARRGFSYEDLQLALKKVGIEKSLGNLRKTINLGKFSFAFFLQCAHVIGLNKLHLSNE